MSRQVVFPELEAAMARCGDKQADVADLLGLNVAQVSRRLSGAVEWRDREIRLMCERYGKPYEILFDKDVTAVAANG